MEKFLQHKIEDEPQDKSPSDLQRNNVVPLSGKEFDNGNSILPLTPEKKTGLLSKCDSYTTCFSNTSIAQAREHGMYPFFREIEDMEGCRVVIDGKKIITVCTNNYLGLTKDPKVIAAGQQALEKFGAGCTGSRFLNGTLSLHNILEKELSSFLEREDAIVMSTGFQANQGTISCLLGRKDIAFSDRENHASIYEGCAVSQGKTVRYRHSDMDHLEYYLKKYSDVEGKLIITDSIFSMSGDIANLPEIVKLARDYNATIMVDEAHGLGVLGDQGKGVTSYYNLEKEIDIYVGTFSKSLGSIGGFVAGSSKVAEFIRHKASSFIFTAALPPASVAGVTKALDIMINEPERLKKLHDNTSYVKKGFFNMGFQVNNNPVPIVPVKIGEEALTLEMNRLLFEDGIFAGVAISPAVPPHSPMIRTSYTSCHEHEDLDKILESFNKFGKKLGVITQ
jgi:8-amino-7-oxononanoate synthase